MTGPAAAPAENTPADLPPYEPQRILPAPFPERVLQPWPAGEHAEAFVRGRGSAPV